MKKNSFVEGTIIATLAIIFTKFLGVIYVIPFYAIIGELGSSLYSYAFNIYSMFLEISTAGLPVAISKLTSELDAKKQNEAKSRAYKLAIKITTIISAICFIILLIFAKEIVYLVIGNTNVGNNIDDIILLVRVVSLSILIIPYLSVAKGYLQGHKFIAPTSVSQMLEQVIRIIVIIVGSYLTLKVFGLPLAFGVSVAVSGAFVGGLFAIAYIKRKINKNKEELGLVEYDKKDNITNKELLKKIASYAIPYIIISLTINIFNVMDMTLIIRYIGNFGFSGAEAEYISGVLTTWGYKINRIVNAVATGLTISLIPNIASFRVLKEYDKVNSTINKALQIVMFTSIPMAVGLSFLAGPVWNTFYGFNELGPVIFKMSILTAIFCNVYLIFIQSAQTLNEYKTLYKAVIIGFSMNGIFDVPFMYLCNLVHIPAFYGATFATMLGYIVAIAIIVHKFKKLGYMNFKETINKGLKIAFSVLVMVGVLSLLKFVIPFTSVTRISSIIYICIYALVGAIVYIFVTYKLGLIKEILGSRIVSKLTFGKIKIKDEENES